MKKVENIEGFTIIEVLVAVIILTLSLLLLLNMAMVALEGNDWSNTATISTQLLQEKLEDLRTTSLLTNGQDTVNNIQRTWTVTNSASHLRRVDITASWYNRQGNLIQNTMTAYIRTDSV